MSPRERVLAALRPGPVDHIPHVEHLFDPQVAAEIAGGIEELTNSSVAAQALSNSGSPFPMATAPLEPDQVVEMPRCRHGGAG